MSRGRGGTGGVGQGNAPPGEAPSGPVDHEKKNLKGATHKGRIAGSFLKDGMPKKGEAQLELQDVVLSGSRHAEQSLEKERIPADLKEIPKRYYEQILQEE